MGNLYTSDTQLLGELENLKIKTRLIDEKFGSVMGGVRWGFEVVYYKSKTRAKESIYKWVSV
jgi:hypothetical protein